MPLPIANIGQPLGRAADVDEHDRGQPTVGLDWVRSTGEELLHRVQEQRVDRPRRRCGRRPAARPTVHRGCARPDTGSAQWATIASPVLVTTRVGTPMRGSVARTSISREMAAQQVAEAARTDGEPLGPAPPRLDGGIISPAGCPHIKVEALSPTGFQAGNAGLELLLGGPERVVRAPRPCGRSCHTAPRQHPLPGSVAARRPPPSGRPFGPAERAAPFTACRIHDGLDVEDLRRSMSPDRLDPIREAGPPLVQSGSTG